MGKNGNGNEYLVFASTDKNKEVLTKYTELWDQIKNLIEKINDNQVNMEKISWRSNLTLMIIYL